MKGISFYGNDFFVIKEGDQLIKENITRILLTTPGERVMSNFGSNVKSMIFERGNVLRGEIEDEIKNSISKWEPRVIVKNIGLEEVDSYSVRIKMDLMFKEDYRDFTFDTIVRT